MRTEVRNLLTVILGVCAACVCLAALIFFGKPFLNEISKPQEMVGSIKGFFIYIPIMAVFAAAALMPRNKVGGEGFWLFVLTLLVLIYASVTPFNVRNALYNPVFQSLAEEFQKSSMLDATSQRTVQNFAAILSVVFNGLAIGVSGGVVIRCVKRYITVISKPVFAGAALCAAAALSFCSYFLLKLIADGLGYQAVFYCAGGFAALICLINLSLRAYRLNIA
ncbi:MAG: hypothetical protein LBQ40_02145 [Clostridiales bacterium]|jgi:hypothetical protein|nr:hypothetical protein [Clostridiales bacterium]